MSACIEKKVKVDIITGFLGAGKTTVILELLKNSHNERIVVCENEFGKASIDAALLQSLDFDVFELREGCICCTLAVELVTGLRNVIDTLRPDRIIIEPTGLARLEDILSALASPDIADRIEIETKAVILDGFRLQKHFVKYLHHFGDQLKHANCVLVSKTESYTQSQRTEAFEALHDAFPALDAVLLPFDGDLWARLHCRSTTSATPLPVHAPVESTAGYTAISVPTHFKGSKERCEALLETKGKWGEIVRAKGYVYDNELRCYRLDYAADALTIEPVQSPAIDEIQLIGIGLNAVAIRSKLGALIGRK